MRSVAEHAVGAGRIVRVDVRVLAAERALGLAERVGDEVLQALAGLPAQRDLHRVVVAHAAEIVERDAR